MHKKTTVLFLLLLGTIQQATAISEKKYIREITAQAALSAEALARQNLEKNKELEDKIDHILSIVSSLEEQISEPADPDGPAET